MFEDSSFIVKDSFLQFRGSGMYLALFFIAMLYLYLKEENKKIKYLLVYFPIAILLITLNPLFQKLVKNIFTIYTYWRVFWMLPIGITISYAFVKVTNKIEDKKEKIVVFVSFIIIIIMSGNFMYTKENFSKLGNWYKLPDESVEVAQLIGIDDEEYKKAIVPESLVAHIRQVDSSIMLAYKREPSGYNGNLLLQDLNSGNVKGVVGRAIKDNCNYVVYSKATVLVGKMEDYGFEKINETQNYAIYKLIDDEILQKNNEK